MTSIENTVNEALPSAARDYPQYVKPVIDALVEREDAIINSIRNYTRGRGFGEAETDSILRVVGLLGFEEPTLEERTEPATTPVEAAIAELQDLANDLLRRVEALAQR